MVIGGVSSAECCHRPPPHTVVVERLLAALTYEFTEQRRPT